MKYYKKICGEFKSKLYFKMEYDKTDKLIAKVNAKLNMMNEKTNEKLKILEAKTYAHHEMIQEKLISITKEITMKVAELEVIIADQAEKIAELKANMEYSPFSTTLGKRRKSEDDDEVDLDCLRRKRFK
jgi:hypothetical protein